MGLNKEFRNRGGCARALLRVAPRKSHAVTHPFFIFCCSEGAPHTRLLMGWYVVYTLFGPRFSPEGVGLPYSKNHSSSDATGFAGLLSNMCEGTSPHGVCVSSRHRALEACPLSMVVLLLIVCESSPPSRTNLARAWIGMAPRAPSSGGLPRLNLRLIEG